jgi:hypothetical protein
MLNMLQKMASEERNKGVRNEALPQTAGKTRNLNSAVTNVKSWES